jgi:hypothetical protein
LAPEPQFLAALWHPSCGRVEPPGVGVGRSGRVLALASRFPAAVLC